MKKVLSLFTVGAVAMTSVVSAFAATTSPDPHSDQHMMEESYVAWAYQNGLTMYQDMAKFRYNDTVTRQESTKMLVKAAEGVFGKKVGTIPETCKTPFLDANKFDPTLAPTIAKACQFDMMTGSNGYFSPLDNLLRAEALAIALRTVDGRQNEETDPWYLGYQTRGIALGLTQLQGNTTDSMINKDITRGELVEWLYTIKKNQK